MIITAIRSDHSTYTVDNTISNHTFGRTFDIGAVDGEICRGTRTGRCADLVHELAAVTGRLRSTELIYCWDPDGPPTHAASPGPTTATTSMSDGTADAGRLSYTTARSTGCDAWPAGTRAVIAAALFSAVVLLAGDGVVALVSDSCVPDVDAAWCA